MKKTKQTIREMLCPKCKKKVRKWDMEYQRNRRANQKVALPEVPGSNIKITK